MEDGENGNFVPTIPASRSIAHEWEEIAPVDDLQI